MRLELKTALGGLSDGVEFAYPFLARLLALPLEPEADAALRELGREAVQQQTFAAMGAVVHRLADAGPLCIVIDDLQWADSLTIELVEDLLALTDQAQLGLVLVYRAERDQPSWGLGERARARLPPPLPRDRAAATRRRCEPRAGGCAGGERLARLVADLLAERAGGNPFFLEEALQDLIERGALLRRDGAWELADGQVAVPTLVQGALQARLDRLPPRTREVVSVASVIGRAFGLPLLERLLPRDQVVPALSDLMRLDLIVEVSRRPAPEYRFRHGLVQEVAYNSLLEPARRSLHRRIGEALVALYGESGDAIAGPIARHFAEADEPELAARYLLAAGDAARAVYADHEAIEHYRRARTFLRRLNDPARERETLFRIALVRHLAFDYVRAGQAYDAAFDCSVEERTERAPAPERLFLSLVRPASYAPGDTYSTDSAIVIEQLFRGLLRVDHDLNVVPELAQNMNVSADGLTYLFMLREDACWSDGHPLTAGDFVFAWRRLREEGHVTAFLLERHHLGGGARRLDARGAPARAAQLLPLRARVALGVPVAAPPRRRGRRRLAAARVARRQRPVRARRGRRGGRETDRQPALAHGRRQRRRGQHRLPGPLERRARRLGARAATTCSSPARPRSRPPTRSPSARPTLSTTFLGFNARNGPIADERVRRAIAHAIDRAALVADSPGVDLAAGTGGAIPPVMPGHSDSVGLAYDLERARELLAEAGYPGRRGAARAARGGAPLVVDRRAGRAARGDRRAGRASRRADTHFGVSSEAHIWLAGWHADYPDPDGFYLGLSSGPAALPGRRDGRGARTGAGVAGPRRAAAPVSRVRAAVDRRARGDRAVSYRGRSCCAARTCTACGRTRWARSTSSRSWSAGAPAPRRS